MARCFSVFRIDTGDPKWVDGERQVTNEADWYLEKRGRGEIGHQGSLLASGKVR